MSGTDRNSNMSKKKHRSSPLNERITDGFKKLQREFKQKSALVPWKPAAILTPAEPSGPDIEVFRNPENALLAWTNKQTQNWKFNGIVESDSDRKFAFQLEFTLRHTQKDKISKIPLRWLKPDVFSAQFAITDYMNANSKKTFRSWSRGGLFDLKQGFAGENRMHIELGGWYAWRNPTGTFSIFAAADGHSTSLHFTPAKPLSYHAQRGFIQKGSLSENSAYFCSYTNLQTKGTVLIDGKLYDVSGVSCLDHEKMTLPSDLFEDEIDFKNDRLSFTLPGNEELYLYLQYNEKNILGNYTCGTLVDTNGGMNHLISTDIIVENQKFWKSEETGARYPVRRKIIIPKLDLDLEIKPLVEKQEFDSFKTNLASTWSGAISASGKRKGENIGVFGFMNLSGYDQRKATHLLKGLIK